MGITYGDHLIDSGYHDITPEQEREIEAREECERRGIDQDAECADGGTTAWMIVAQEIAERTFNGRAKEWHARMLIAEEAVATQNGIILSCSEKLAKAEAALRNIAEGNIGDGPGQANYARIRAVALAALFRADLANQPSFKSMADWSGLPKDIYITSAKSDGAVWHGDWSQVPMAIGPEVRFSRATSPKGA